jgi:DNA-damage-inducible protein D
MSEKEVTTIQWDGHDLDIIDKDGERWVTASQLAEVLGYSDHKKLLNLIDRNIEEFTNKVSYLKLRTQNYEREQRVINYRGVIRASMLARTEKAKRFRNEAEDILYKVMVEKHSLVSPENKEWIVEEINRLKDRDDLKIAEKELSKDIYNALHDGPAIGRIRNAGDIALFKHPTKVMKKKLGVSEKKPLADKLPRALIAGKNFAAILTSETIKNRKLDTERGIRGEHIGSNKVVRGSLLRAGVVPEEVEADVDCKKLERKHKRLEKGK